MIKPWKLIGSTPAGDYRIFTVRKDRSVSPRTGKEHDFFVIDCANWVNVVATTPGDQLVMIEQYRHGSQSVELEIPGGMIDATDASPAEAGARELREETGYEGEEPQIIGSILPNPAFMSNTCYTLYVKNCSLKHPLQWDHGEDIVTKLVPIADIPKLLATGQVRHSLVAVALNNYLMLKAGR